MACTGAGRFGWAGSGWGFDSVLLDFEADFKGESFLESLRFADADPADRLLTTGSREALSDSRTKGVLLAGSDFESCRFEFVAGFESECRLDVEGAFSLVFFGPSRITSPHWQRTFLPANEGLMP